MNFDDTGTIQLPYYETIPVGSPSAAQTNLLAGYRYIHYSTPLDEPIWLIGFNANFSNVLVRITLANMAEPGVWIPFYNASMAAIVGAVGQVEPVLSLAAPYLVNPGSRIQITLLNSDVSNISDTKLTLVGSRVRRVG